MVGGDAIAQPATSIAAAAETDWGAVLLALLATATSLGAIWFTARLNKRHADAIEQLKDALEFQRGADRNVLEKRMTYYEKLLALLQNLPKYPEPRVLTTADLKSLAVALQALYFGGAGIYMTRKVRDAYFDLQDGIRIVLAKAEEIALRLPAASADDRTICEHLERPSHSTIPARLKALLGVELEAGPIPLPTLGHLRMLGSDLRTAMADDLDSRRDLYGSKRRSSPAHQDREAREDPTGA